MKNLLLGLLLFSSILSFAKDREAGMNCKRFRTGKFVMYDTLSGTTYIERFDTYQVETSKEQNYKIELHIKWISECAYVLTFSRVISDPNGLTAGMNKNLVITNTIKDITGDSYTQSTTAPEFPVPLMFKISKVK